MLAAITPGPWKLDDELRWIQSSDGRVVKVFPKPGRFDDNDRFIAAAPEVVASLLAEIERLRSAAKWEWGTLSGHATDCEHCGQCTKIHGLLDKLNEAVSGR